MKKSVLLSIGLLAFGVWQSPACAQTPFNRIQSKGSHNTIDRTETLLEALQFDRTTPSESGVRSLEFDLVVDPSTLAAGEVWGITVQHDLPYDWKTATLADCLTILANWHRANPGHDVITVILDLKNAPGPDEIFAQQIEGVFRSTLGVDNLFTPGMLQGDAAHLLAGARTNGWPTTAALVGKFLLVFSGSDSDPEVARRRVYLATSEPTRRLAFVDIDQRVAGLDPSVPPYTDGTRVFINLAYRETGWCRLAVAAQRATGFATRIWVLNDRTAWERGLAAGVNILSTDKVRHHSWARVGKRPIATAPASGDCG